MPPAKKVTKKTTKKRGPRKGSMSAAHKSALAEGREASRAVRAYLDALETTRPKRGRRLDPDTVRKRVAEIDTKIKGASAFERLNLLADRDALLGKLAGTRESVPFDLVGLRKEFVKHAATYGKRKGISYATWRAAGVSAEDLKAAGIKRGKG